MSYQLVEELEPGPLPGTVEAVDIAETPTPVEITSPHRQSQNLPPLWRNRDYMLLWSGQTISSTGSAASGIVFPLLILALTNSPVAAGIAGALFTIPYLLFSLPVGALIDRWNRKRVMIFCDLGRALSLASVPIAIAFGALTVWQLYANAFIEGTLFVFFNIAEVACLPRVVTKAQLPAATAQNEISMNTSALIGPPLGGFIFKVLGQAFPFIVDAASYTFSVFSLLFIKTEFQGERTAAKRNLRAEIMEGLSWLWQQRVVRTMAMITGGLNFVNAATWLLLIVLATRLGADSTAIGVLVSIGAVGGIVGALIGGRIQKRFRFGQVVAVTIIIETFAFPLYAIAHNIIVLGLVSAIIWLTIPIYNVTALSYRVALIPDALQGRVNSASRLISWGTQPAGAFLSGLFLQWFGPVPTILIFSAFMLGVCALAVFNPDVRNAPPIEELQVV